MNFIGGACRLFVNFENSVVFVASMPNFVYVQNSLKSQIDLNCTYRICPIKRALSGGNDRVCVYLLVKNGNVSFTSKNSILLSVDKQDPRSCPIHSP